MAEDLKSMCERILKGGTQKEQADAAAEEFVNGIIDTVAGYATQGIMIMINELVGPYNGGSPVKQRDNIVKILDVYIPIVAETKNNEMDGSVHDHLLRTRRLLKAMTDDELQTKLKAFMNLSYPVLLDAGPLVKQFGDPRIAGATLPLFVVIGPDGKIAHYHVGTYEVRQDQGLKELDQVVTDLMGKK